ncbi:hypothetical protein O181_003709 [Austropuccinia psidii MF-1]|uniref:Uncharacterized protein n=1 Tax=Austropuccinia psidii MF-1 TaxID=1389203 RepID=A0A9Q3BEH6_9BASI|nr:hypothetical protein [Austropuccinia psidii MF-1]
MCITRNILLLAFLSYLNGSPFELLDPVTEITNAYRAAMDANPDGEALIVTDFNGVLYDRPKGERATVETVTPIREFLQAVTSHPRNHVYVVSAKHPRDLNLLLGTVSNLGLSAEHNMAFKERGAGRFRYVVAPKAAKEVLDEIDKLIEVLLSEQFKVDGYSFKIVNDKTDPEQYHIKVMLDVKGKQTVITNALQNKNSYVFGLSLGDKPADQGMHIEMKKYGFLSAHVSEVEEVTQAYYTLNHPRDVARLFRLLASISNSFLK